MGKCGKRDDAGRREREKTKLAKNKCACERRKGAVIDYAYFVFIVSCLSLRSSSSSVLWQSKEPTFAIRSEDGSACEEPGSRNKIDVEKEKRWSR